MPDKWGTTSGTQMGNYIWHSECMYVCMYVHVHVCMFVCLNMYVCMHA